MPAPDGVKCLKMETPDQGTQLDWFPTEVNPLQDAVEAAGLFVQNTAGSVIDKTTAVARSGADLTLTDANAGTKKVQDLVTRVRGAVGHHASLADLAHYISDGPPEGANGAFLAQVFSGPLLTSRAWFTSSAKTQTIYSEVFTYNGPLLATATYSVFGSTGALVRSAQDTFGYSGPLCTSVTRTWS